MSERVRTARVRRYERIDVDNPRDVMFWTGRWGLTDQQLREAVAIVGPVAADVAACVGQDVDG